MKKIILLSIAIFIASVSFAKEVQIDQAKKTAITFLQHSSKTNLKSSSQFELSLVEGLFSPHSPNHTKSAQTDLRDLYIFNINQSKGFIIVSGNDAVFPILAYSNTNSINTNTIPHNVRGWLENYQQQIRHIRENNIEQTTKIKYYWDNGISKNLKSTQQDSVAPLLTTKWDQGPYYSARCPYDYDADKLTYSGCVPTAWAQIMKYWEYPEKGMGFNSYQSNFDDYGTFGTLYANFGKTYYNWDAMPDSVSSPNDAVATLVYHVGVALEAMYGANGTGVNGNTDSIQYEKAFHLKQEVLLSKYFNYSKSMQQIYRQYYSNSQWTDILKLELDSGRPVQYIGINQEETGGHAFVCDGYDTNDFFHFNWGWGGSGDGYFFIDNLTPGQHNFNFLQTAFIGIKPSEPSELLKLKLSNNVAANKSTIIYEEGFTVNAEIINEGTTGFNGDFAAAVFNDKYTLIDFVEISTDQNLQPGENYPEGVSFATQGIPSLIPGSYRAYILYREEGGEWLALQSDSLHSEIKDYIDIEVISNNKIRLFTEMNLSSNEIFPNYSLSVSLNIANDSIADFNGSFNLSVYNLNGELIRSIEEKTDMNLNVGTHFADSLAFSTSNIELEPGSYLLKLQHKWEGSDYKLTGSTATSPNPIKINIQEPPLLKDPYEDNNSPYEICNLPISWIDDKAVVKTEGSNIHEDNDLDFYSLNLDPEYTYIIDARLHDALSSDDGNNYSVDALFLYSLDGVTPSEKFDLMLPAPLSVSELDKIYFIVSAFFENAYTGSYSLEINLTRSLVSAVEAIESPQEISVFPNPFHEKITISASTDILRYQLFDINGHLLRDQNVSSRDLLINFSALKHGTYFLKITTESKTFFKSIVKN